MKTDFGGYVAAGFLILFYLGFFQGAFAAPSAEDMERDATLWLGPEELPATAAGIGRAVPDMEISLIDGSATRLHQATGSRGTVVVVRDPECPVSRRYGPRIAKMARAYAEQGFHFVVLYLNDELSVTSMQDDALVLGIVGSYVGQGSFHLANLLGVESTGDVFVLDAQNKIRFRGAVDDQYGLGYTRGVATRHYLRDALDALVRGEAVPIPATNAPGCLIDADPDKDRIFEPVTPGGVLS